MDTVGFVTGADDLNRLERLFTAHEPEELRHGYFAVPDADVRFAGSTVVPLGVARAVVTSSGLTVPASAHQHGPLDYTGVYVTLDQYLTPDRADWRTDGEAIRDGIARSQTANTTILHLALMNTIVSDRAKTDQLLQDFRSTLRPDICQRLDNVLRDDGVSGKHQLLARQPILAAMRFVIEGGGGAQDTESPAFTCAALLSHAVAVDLSSKVDAPEELYGIPESLFFEILRLGVLYESGDMLSSIDRVVRLWQTYGPQVARFPTRAVPSEMLREATGLELEEMLGLAFALFAHATHWEPGKPAYLAADMGSGMPPEKLEAFRRLVARTLDDLKEEFATRTKSTFDFLPLQEHPVLLADQGLLVLDPDFLWERVTSGLYWLVHDYEKQRSERDRQRWSQGFGEMVELMTEDELRRLAPLALGGGTTFYTEEDFERAYGQTKRCDAAIDFGSTMLLVEVVSGQLSVQTRIDGDPDKFRADTDRLVIGKCRQLDAACKAVLADATGALTGFPTVPGLKLVPVVVVGGGYPVNPFTVTYITSRLSEEELFSDPRIHTLCIIDLGELEMLEGLGERGHDPVTVLIDWKQSAIGKVPLRNHILRRWGGGSDSRPARMKASVDATFERLISLLRLPPGTPEEPAL